MATIESYDNAYKSARSAAYQPNQSLLKTLDHRLIDVYVSENQDRTLDLLETGCGNGSQLLYWKKKPHSTFIEAFDWSSVAIEQARGKIENEEIKFSVKHAESFEYPQQFDIILDGHLLHCLTEAEDRKNYITRVVDHLKPGGMFLGETMIEHKNFLINDAIEAAYAEKIIYYKGEAQRYLADSFEIEDFLIDSGLRIEFFYIPMGLRVVPFPYRDNALSSDPEMVRFIARKVDK